MIYGVETLQRRILADAFQFISAAYSRHAASRRSHTKMNSTRSCYALDPFEVAVRADAARAAMEDALAPERIHPQATK